MFKSFLYFSFTKTFWKDVCHKDFTSDVSILSNDEALKYMPSIQQSCKIFNSNDEQICVDLFKSVYVNGILFAADVFQHFSIILNLIFRYALAVYWWS